MAKQTNKTDLVHDILTERSRLEKTLAGISVTDKLVPDVNGEWSVKDILAHLTAWEQFFLGWYQAGLRGEAPINPIPDSGHAIDDLNSKIYTQNAARSLPDVEAEFAQSYQQVLALVQTLAEKDLFTPGRYAWTGKHRLVDYITPNTSNHYFWANNLIRRWIKDGQQTRA